jgi:glycosyltransferase involved in cell wall biosynthesis
MDLPTICYHGFLGGPRSMGRVGTYLLLHLVRSKRFQVRFHPFKNDYMAPRWGAKVRRLIDPAPDAATTDQMLTFCSVLNAQRPRLARRMTPWLFYELSSLPEHIAAGINTNDHVYATSDFVRRVFVDHGVTVPVSVLGHGFDPAHYQYAPRQVNGPFTFLCIAENTPRKNLPGLVRSFERAFADRDDVQLLLKIGLHGVGDLRSTISQPRKVILVTEALPGDAELARLYHSAHCFVLPTRGEGFGMPVLEAMATGLPVIVTDYSGHLDFCNEENAYLIRNRGLVDSDTACFPHLASQWADPDEDHLVELMRHVYGNYQDALDKAKCAYETVRENWTWQAQLSRAF